MFGHNEVVGQRFFREASGLGKLLVTSIFVTIQGEGPYAGMPAVFVRLAKCNLACSFCDTYFDSGEWFEPEALLDAIHEKCLEAGHKPALLVVTGGEPTLQPQLGVFLFRAGVHFKITQIESNGLLAADVPTATTVVVSPKVSEGSGKYLKLPERALARADCLKFVVSGDPDSPYRAVPEWAREWRWETQRDVFVSPMAEYNHEPAATRAIYDARRAPSMSERNSAERVSFWEPGLLDMEKCRRNYEYAAEYALRHGLRLSIQMHLFASMP